MPARLTPAAAPRRGAGVMPSDQPRRAEEPT